MKRLSILFVLITAAVAVAIFGCNKKTVQPDVVYLIDAYVGDVQVSHNGTDWLPAEVGMELKQADVIKTGDNSFCDIVMPNRGIFRVTYNSVIYLSKLTEKIEELEVRQGRIAVNVTEKLEADEDFRISTGTAVVAIRGTQFVLEMKPSGDFNTVVKEGVVVAKPAVNLSRLNNAAVRSEVDKNLEVKIEANQAVSFNPQQTAGIQNAIDSQISDTTAPEQAGEIVQSAIQEANVQVTPADSQAVSSEFSDIVGQQAQQRIQRRVQEYQESVQALDEAIRGVGGNRAESVVGDQPSTREEDEAALNEQVQSVNQRVGSTGMAEQLVGDQPTTREEDEATLNQTTSQAGQRVGQTGLADRIMNDSSDSSSGTTTTVSDEDSLDSASQSMLDRVRRNR